MEVFCKLPFSAVRVQPNGDLSMCCYQNVSLGNLFEEDFEALWFSELAHEIRLSTLAQQLHPVCLGWGGCPHIFSSRVPKLLDMHGDYPTSLDLDLPNTHCNIGGMAPTRESACIMCPRSAATFSPESDRTFELVERLRPLMPHLRELRIQGTAEPFWRDYVFEVLLSLDFPAHKQQCTFSTYTNGTVFGTERRERFIDLCPRARLFFSIDAATPQTYQRIRRLDLFDRVVENIRAFVSQKRPAQRVEVSNNLNLLNLHEAVQMVELAKELGIDAVQFNPTHDGGTGRRDLLDIQVNTSNFRVFADAQARIVARAQELKVTVHFVRPLDLGFSERPGQRAHVPGEWSDDTRPMPRQAPAFRNN